jgi:SAM-dependent MidA family methyltransferase
LDQLLKRAPADRHDDIISAVERLVDPTSMGTQYRAMAVVPKGLALPVPFVA